MRSEWNSTSERMRFDADSRASAARIWGADRVWVIFQPHRFTRTKFLMDDFARAFDDAERVYVLDIYPASEPPIPGITSERLVERMKELGFNRARYAPSEERLPGELLAERCGANQLLAGECCAAQGGTVERCVDCRLSPSAG